MTSEKPHTRLEVQNLSIGYLRKKDTIVISESIDFSLTEGQLIGLIGANGIGKSTLIRTLAGIQQPLSGKILYENMDGKSMSHLALAKKLSVVLTETPASRNLTVREFISLGRQPHTNWLGSLSETDLEIIQEAIQNTECTKLAERKCFELSDGQLQRVAIARALAQDTPVIILDEPTTHLDLYHRVYILKMLQRLSKETAKTIMFSTHEIDLAIQLCDTLIVMGEKSLFCDTPKRLMEENRFDSLFPGDSVKFDKETGRFNIG